MYYSLSFLILSQNNSFLAASGQTSKWKFFIDTVAGNDQQFPVLVFSYSVPSSVSGNDVWENMSLTNESMSVLKLQKLVGLIMQTVQAATEENSSVVYIQVDSLLDSLKKERSETSATTEPATAPKKRGRKPKA